MQHFLCIEKATGRQSTRTKKKHSNFQTVNILFLYFLSATSKACCTKLDFYRLVEKTIHPLTVFEGVTKHTIYLFYKKKIIHTNVSKSKRYYTKIYFYIEVFFLCMYIHFFVLIYLESK